MYLIGITGLIGSGKTTVGQILKSLGFVVFDMDVWCRKMYYDKAFLKTIKKNFPQAFDNNQFNKKILREFVFQNHEELKKLESLTHPYLIKKFKNTIHRFRFYPGFVFIETALLSQMNLDRFCSSVFITKAPLEVMKNRVITRDSINPESFQNIIEKQEDILYFEQDSFIINTNKNLNTLKSDLIKLIQGLNIYA